MPVEGSSAKLAANLGQPSAWRPAATSSRPLRKSASAATGFARRWTGARGRLAARLREPRRIRAAGPQTPPPRAPAGRRPESRGIAVNLRLPPDSRVVGRSNHRLLDILAIVVQGTSHSAQATLHGITAGPSRARREGPLRCDILLTPATSTMTLLLEPGTTVAGAYRLERALARGGMGAVWIARHVRLDVDVAIKFMAPELAASAEARARFEREAKACAQLKSPHVVQVHDYGVADETPYLVMELLDGEGSRDARLRRVGRLGPAEALAVVDQVCKALRRGARGRARPPRSQAGEPVHQPPRRGGGGQGARLRDRQGPRAQPGRQIHKTGTLIGSPHYMSPEQIRRGKLVDHRSDLWSLGGDRLPVPRGPPALLRRGARRGARRGLHRADPAPLAARARSRARGGPLLRARARARPGAALPERTRARRSVRSDHDGAAGSLEPWGRWRRSRSRAGAQAAGRLHPGARHLRVCRTRWPRRRPPRCPRCACRRRSLPSIGTLAPSGGTVNTAPKAGSRAGLVVGVAAVALAIGASVLAFALRGPTTAAASAAAPAGTTASTMTTGERRASAAFERAVADTKASARASSPPRRATHLHPRHAPRRPRRGGPAKRPGTRSTDAKRGNDPLDSR